MSYIWIHTVYHLFGLALIVFGGFIFHIQQEVQ